MSATEQQKLNLGCGNDIRSGYINLDVAKLPGVDVVHDLGELPLPFESERFSEVVCQDVLEHVDLVSVMRELHRILIPGGRLVIRVPHFTCRCFYVDPTHVRAFSIDTMRFFVNDSHFGRGYYFDFAFDREESAMITFYDSCALPWNVLMKRLVNQSQKLQRYYEHTFLARLFPALNVETILIK